jgi:hypothetical protein
MSWCVNQGPSFNNVLYDHKKLNGFYQRFELLQSDNRMTPGKRQPVLPGETMKGTWKLKKSKGKPKKKVVKPSDNIPKAQPMPIYSGFGNVKNKASRKVQKQGGKLKKRTVRQ